jgi:uncharacterized OsmC-like protein
MNQQAMQSALRRAEHVFSKRPEVAQIATISKACVRDDMRCEFSEDHWTFVADMPEPLGGTGTGPSPSTLARAALCTCLAIGYSMRAACLGVPIRGVEVELRADSDLRSLYCGRTELPDYSALAFVVTLDSDAPESDLQRMLDEADERSPILRLFKASQRLHREVRVVRAAAAA